MNKLLVLIILVLFSISSHAELLLKQNNKGDHHVYFPNGNAKNILVVAHGMYNKTDNPTDVSKRFIKRWRSYANKYGLIVIAPVFDNKRWGMFSHGYGGYRNLFGRHQNADVFVNQLVDHYSKQTSTKSKKFYLYGHSAGGQFTNRYVVTHPQRIIKAVVSAAGRYSYPNQSVPWPYGAGMLVKSIGWKNPNTTKDVLVSKRLVNYAQAASKISIVIGSLDQKLQPRRPAHIGTTRIEIARSWANAMNANSKKYGMTGQVNVNVINGIKHDSKKLTPHCAKVLFSELEV